MINAVILAAGCGTRLGLKDRPKPLADINGRPFITYLFDQLIDAGFKTVIVCIAHMADKFYEILGTKYKTLDIIYSIENEPLNRECTKEGITSRLEGLTLFMNGDTYVDMDLGKFIANFIEEGYTEAYVHNAKSLFAGIELIKHTKPNIYFHTAEFIDIGTPETYKLAQETLK